MRAPKNNKDDHRQLITSFSFRMLSFSLVLAFFLLSYASASLPVVIWHGMGDSGSSSGMGRIKGLIEGTLGVYVLSIETGSNQAKDVFSGFFGNVNDQVAVVCDQIRKTPELSGGYNAVGFSQGGQFLRAVAERCQHTGPAMNILVTLGSQHQGVLNVPGCEETALGLLEGDSDGKDLSLSPCSAMQALLAQGAYSSLVQPRVVQAQYFKDPKQIDKYFEKSIFLADINNERQGGVKNQQYKTNLASLSNLVLFRFTNDTTVVPRDSAWFSFFNGSSLVPLEEQALYKEDWIGLQELDVTGRLELKEIEGPHMHFSLSWFKTEVIDAYLSMEQAASKVGQRSTVVADVE